MSDVNYTDGKFGFEDVRELARERQGDRVVISWIPPQHDDLLGMTPRIRQCVDYMLGELPEYLSRHGVDGKRLAELRTEVYVAANARLYVRAFALDDRGREYVSFV